MNCLHRLRSCLRKPIDDFCEELARAIARALSEHPDLNEAPDEDPNA